MTDRQLCFYRREDAAAAIPLPGAFVLRRFAARGLRLSPGRLPGGPTTARYLLWRFAAAGNYEIYDALVGHRVVHRSHVVRKDFRFPFMAHDDLLIGPCWTADDHRGHGLYPAALSRIATDHPNRRVWIFAAFDNPASRRGIEKAGFREIGHGVKRLGRYRLTVPAC